MPIFSSWVISRMILESNLSELFSPILNTTQLGSYSSFISGVGSPRVLQVRRMRYIPLPERST